MIQKLSVNDEQFHKPLATAEEINEFLAVSSERLVDFEKNFLNVIAKIRPLSQGEKCTLHRQNRGYQLHPENKNVITIEGSRFGQLNYKFDLILREESPQDNLFDFAVEMVKQAVEIGRNSTIIVYGQTGSGKTYTIQGDGRYAKGIAHCFFWQLAHHVRRFKRSGGFDITVSSQMVDIYFTSIQDMLNMKNRSNIRVSPDQDGMIVFEGAKWHHHDLTNLYKSLTGDFDKGKFNRMMRTTIENEASSRSHLIFTVKIERTEKFHKRSDEEDTLAVIKI